ncbi:MAG: AI-2E family transporter, partial [Candidatus Eisenbacteria bacterium]
MTTDARAGKWMRISLGSGFGVLVLWALYEARDVMVILIFSMLIAHALSPTVDLLEKLRCPFTRLHLGRRLASSVVVLVALFVVGVLLYRVVPAAVSQIGSALVDFPSYLERLRSLVADLEVQYGQTEFVSNWLSSLEGRLGEISLESGRFIGKGVYTAVNFVIRLISLILVPVATFYLLYDSKRLRDGLLDLVPDAHRARAE